MSYQHKPGDRLAQLVHAWDIPNEDCFCLIHVKKMNEWGDHCINCKPIIALWMLGSARKLYPRLAKLFPTFIYYYARILVELAVHT